MNTSFTQRRKPSILKVLPTTRSGSQVWVRPILLSSNLPWNRFARLQAAIRLSKDRIFAASDCRAFHSRFFSENSVVWCKSWPLRTIVADRCIGSAGSNIALQATRYRARLSASVRRPKGAGKYTSPCSEGVPLPEQHTQGKTKYCIAVHFTA